MKYTGEYTKEIIFPLGGIGTGSIGIGGNGRLCDFEIFNRANKGSVNGYTHFAVRAIDKNGNVCAKVLCGDVLKDLMGQYSKIRFGGYGFGVMGGAMQGFPHFSDWSFECRFPFARLEFFDSDFPAKVTLTGFNPFIPMDEDASGLPAAFFEIEFENTSNDTLRFGSAFSVAREFLGKNFSETVDGKTAVFMKSSLDADSIDYKDMTVVCLEENAKSQSAWYRGTWQDPIATFWREFSEDTHKDRNYTDEAKCDHGTVYCDKELLPNESCKQRFLLTWNAPNCYNYWSAYKDSEGRDVTWKNYYATLFCDSRASAEYACKNWDSLRVRSENFSRAIYESTLDHVIIDAVTANLCTLKSPTVLRLEGGELWAWEGVHELEGSCEGTCTHVWNYAYALPFLFPRLERSLRESEYKYNQFENGLTGFRIQLPLGRENKQMPCLDGQMGGVIKTYREWKLSGDTVWLRSIWENVKRALEFAWVDDGIWSWDANRDGVLEGRQHHTLDMELFGSSAWLEGFYLAALKAGAEMAEALGDNESAKVYRDLFKKGSEWTEKNLFNGKYYIQKIELSDKSLPERFGVADTYWNDETGEIKYQIGEGCEIDQLCAQWHAHLCGLGDVFDKENRRVALRSLYENNFKPTMRSFVNPWRVFVANDEAGAVMCDYPNGVKKPTIPVPYCEECMSGFEYALAELMIAEGMRDEGMKIIRSIRARSDGKKRNPFNEIECGSNYARAMASFGAIMIFSGFEYDMTKGSIGFSPVDDPESFGSLFACGGAWGSVDISKNGSVLSVCEGTLTLRMVKIPNAEHVRLVRCDGEPVGFAVADGYVCFEHEISVEKKLEFVF